MWPIEEGRDLGWRYAQMLSDICDGEYPSLHELLSGLRMLTQAEIAVLVWHPADRDAEVRLMCARDVPMPLDSFFADPSVDAALRRLESLDDCGSLPIPVSEAAYLDVTAYMMPPLFGEDAARGRLFICLFDRLVRVSPIRGTSETDLKPVAACVRTWAWWLSYERQLTFRSSERIASVASERRMADGAWAELCWHLENIGRTLSIRELVVVANNAFSAGTYADPRFLEQYITTEDDGLWDLREPWLPPSQRGGVSRRNLAKALVYLSWWRDVDPRGLWLLRRKSCPEWWDDREWKKHRKHLANARSTVKQLATAAGRAVRPHDNVLPKGMHNFFLSQALGSAKSMRWWDWESDTVSDGELTVALSSVARTSHYLLADLPIDEKTIESMIWLLSEYAHHTLGVPERIDLRAHLLQAARDEPALHVLRSFYRDHFFHAIEVCFLGHFLLDLKLSSGRQLWELVAAHLRFPADRKRVLRLWYLAALLHDVGYGIDVLKGVQKLLKFFENASPMKDLVRGLKDSLDGLSGELGREMFVEFVASDKPGEDHGVVAARHLRGLLKHIGGEDKKVDPWDYEPAVRAIALHNCHKKPVSFSRDPLAFVLILCDTIQEWNRPRLSFATAPARLLAKLTEHGVQEEDLTGPLQSVKLDVKQEKGVYHLPDGDNLCFTLEYNEDIRENAGVFNLWLDASCNFQRLKFDGLPPDFDVEVTYRTPFFQKSPADTPEPQLHRLRDAANEMHMAFLDRWFPPGPPAADGQPANAVKYAVEDHPPGRPPIECLSLHLRALSELHPITKTIDEFRERLVGWQRYSEDREFAGDYGAPECIG